jgi:4-hydroxyacetophenone monooxygenase
MSGEPGWRTPTRAAGWTSPTTSTATPYFFSTQELLLGYFRRFAREHGLTDNIRFGTTVEAAEFDETRCGWRLQVEGPRGAEVLEADAVILAVGQLNRPRLPDIPGIDDFGGPSFHSSQWDHDVDLAGKRVALVGTGASGAQIIPELAEVAAELRVFQRTPPWVLPAPNYRQRIPAGKRWLFDHVPDYHRWYRLWNFYRSSQVLLPFSEVDPAWTGGHGSVGARNEAIRQLLTAHLNEQFADRPELLPKLTPRYPPLAKRVVFDDGTLLRALRRDNVHLITERVSKITASGVTTETGDHDVDVIVYATGFAASEFFAPIRIRGRGGVDLHEWWRNDPRAYLGMMVPGFPNLFSLYGPNTNIVVNGSIFFFSECAVRYLIGCIRELLATGAGALEVREDVYAAYNEEIDAGNRRRVWASPGVNSWYKNPTGRVSQVWPLPMSEYWARTRAPRPGEHRFLRRPT